MTQLRAGAIQVARKLRAHGHESFFAGGCVRDRLLGLEPKDYDIVTDATPERVGELFPRSIMVGAAFGVVRVQTSRRREYEVATYRMDGQYSDGRRPDDVTYATSKEDDVRRRDFTINALLEDPESSEVLDFVEGRRDLKAQVIRAVGDPERRFEEDRLRMLRAVRFAARLGFSIEASTRAAIETHAASVGDVSVERIVNEMHGIWASKHPDVGARLMVETGLLPAVFSYLGDVDSREVIERHARFPSAFEPLEVAAQRAVAWAAMLDLSVALDPAMDVHKTLRDLKLSRPLLRQVPRLIDQRQGLVEPESLSEAQRVRFAARDDFETLFAFVHVLQGGDAPALDVWRGVCASLRQDPLPERPLITGNDLRQLGLQPGPQFKEILAALDDEIFERRVVTKEQAMQWVRAHHT